jgi:hypothetical protein
MNSNEQWDGLAEAWASISPAFVSDFHAGGATVRLEFSSFYLGKKLSRAFEHLRADVSSRPDLIIRVWDTVQSGVPLPPLDWNVMRFNGYRGCHVAPFYYHCFESIQALSILNLDENIAYYILRDEALLPWWVGGSPFQVIVHAWFQARQMQLTHAAAVSWEGKGLVLAGKGGSGKSTTTLACLLDGWGYLSEDYVLIEAQTGPLAHSIYQSAKWRPATRHMFPGFDRFIVNPETADSEKALVYYQDIFPRQMTAKAELVAIVSLEIGTEDRPSLIPSDSESSLKNLMMSTIHQLPFRHNQTVEILKKTVLQLRNYRLCLGKDGRENVSLLRELIAQFVLKPAKALE